MNGEPLLGTKQIITKQWGAGCFVTGERGQETKHSHIALRVIDEHRRREGREDHTASSTVKFSNFKSNAQEVFRLFEAT